MNALYLLLANAFLILLLSGCDSNTNIHSRNERNSFTTKNSVTIKFPNDRIIYSASKQKPNGWQSRIKTKRGADVLVHGDDLFMNYCYFGVIKKNDQIEIENEEIKINGKVRVNSKYSEDIVQIFNPTIHDQIVVNGNAVEISYTSGYEIVNPLFGQSLLKFGNVEVVVKRDGEIEVDGFYLGSAVDDVLCEEHGYVFVRKKQ